MPDTRGLNELHAAVEPFTLEHAAARCEVPAAQIAEAARLFKMIATNVTQPSMPPSETGFEVAGFGVELGGIVGEDASPDVFQPTSKFKLTITAKNKKHAIRTDYNDIVTLRAVSALTWSPARTYLIPAQVKLESGFTELSVQYTFAEPIQIEIRDDDGFDNPADDQPRTGPLFAVTETVDIVPGPPDTLVLASHPPWVQGNKHATLSATVTASAPRPSCSA